MNFTLELINKIKILLFMFLILIPLAIISSPVILLAIGVRHIIEILAEFLRPDLNGLVKKEQAIFAYKKSRKAALNILIRTAFKGEIDLEEFREDFRKKVLEFRRNNDAVYEKLQNTWTSFLGYAFWKIDANFDLKNHIRNYDYTGPLRLPHRPDETDVDRVLAGLVEAPWNRDRSAWEILKVSDYQLEGESHSLFFIRIDHTLADGFSIIEILRKVFQCDLTMPKISLGKKPASMRTRLFLLFKLPYQTSENMLMVLGASKLQNSKFSMEEAAVSVSPILNVATMKKIKNHFNVNYAVVVYSIILGGIAKCLKYSGQKIPEKLTSAFVVPIPNHPGGLCVHASVIASEWPLKFQLPEERLLMIQENFESISRSSAALTYIFLGRLSANFPVAMRKIIIEGFLALGISVGMTSFPVTTSRDYYKGHELVEYMGCVGTWGKAGLIITSCGVNGKQRMCISINKSVFASDDAAQNLGRYVNQELEDLLQATLTN